ncbi:MAG: hypothetical protein VX231_00825 [Pseudomonadota bacterium]|nr:hypothetical protein [Pseudomonadota bacterium]
MNKDELAEGIEDLLFTSFSIYEKFAKTLKKSDPARVAWLQQSVESRDKYAGMMTSKVLLIAQSHQQLDQINQLGLTADPIV